MASVAAGNEQLRFYSVYYFLYSVCFPQNLRPNCNFHCLCKAKRKIIGSDPGISAEFNGGTHMSMEDIGVLRSIPELVIYEPVDVAQFKQALPQIVAYEGPVYIRMFRKTIDDVFTDANYKFDLFWSRLYSGRYCSYHFLQRHLWYRETMKANEIFETRGH